MTAPRPPIACWRVKGDPAKRLAPGSWTDGAPTIGEMAEYQRLGWRLEFAYALDNIASPADESIGTLRDAFAMRAMHAELITCTVPGAACDALVAAIEQTGETPEDHMARSAYEVADAMLRARKVQS
jgi:hypothetical protein